MRSASLGFRSILLSLLACPGLCWAEPKITPDVVYGHKDGLAMTFDVLRPETQNGAAVLWIQSGGWYSVWVDPKRFLVNGKIYLDKDYTLFIVRHGSAPKYAIPDATADVRRAVRYIRRHARDFGIDPERLGVIGASAGGHLSCMLGTTGDDGDPASKDEVLTTSSRVACVVAIYPPTDLSEWVPNPPEIIKKNPSLKPPLTFDPKLAPEHSPLLKVTDKSAPTLFIHGDKDLLVPIEHSQKMHAALEKAGVSTRLVTIEGAAHGFNPKQTTDIVVPATLEWFDKYLLPKK